MAKLLTDWYIQLYESMYGGSNVYTKLTLYSDAIRNVLTPSGILYDIYQIIITLGTALLCLYFLISWGTKAIGKELSISGLFVSLLKFFVGYCLILKAFDIVSLMFDLGDSMAAMLIPDSELDELFIGPMRWAFLNSMSKVSLGKQIAYLFKAIIPYALCLISEIVITYTIITRVLRICVNAAMAPVACAGIFDDSRHTDAVRFLKKTLAMALQCSMIMVITLTVGLVSQKMNVNVDDGRDSLANLVSTLEPNSDAVNQVREDIAVLYTGFIPEETSEQENDMLYQKDSDGNYILDEEGNKMLKYQYTNYDEDAFNDFLNMILGGSNYWTIILLLLVKIGLIKKSNSLCNTIVGV